MLVVLNLPTCKNHPWHSGYNQGYLCGPTVLISFVFLNSQTPWGATPLQYFLGSVVVVL